MEFMYQSIMLIPTVLPSIFQLKYNKTPLCINRIILSFLLISVSPLLRQCKTHEGIQEKDTTHYENMRA